MRRSLTYYGPIHLAVVFGVAVATAVLTGALLVGDSVRGSLRDLTLDRLGLIDYALVSQRYFRSDLYADLAAEKTFQEHFEAIGSAILLRGTALGADTKLRASGIQIQGVDEQFTKMFDQDLDPWLSKQPGQVFPSVVINRSLQRELAVSVGDEILLSFERPSDIHREYLFGKDDASDVMQTVRVTISHILPDRGIGRFSLQPHQSLPSNAYLLLKELQRAMGQPGRVNTILVASRMREKDDVHILNSVLHRSLKLDDMGFVLRPLIGQLSLESTQFILKPGQIEVAEALAVEQKSPVLPVLTYLANEISAGDRLTPYSLIAGLDIPNENSKAFGEMKLLGGHPAPDLASGEILLNEWIAKDLEVETGDSIRVRYYVVGSGEELLTRNTAFVLKGILSMGGLAADQALSPEFPGLQEADDMGSWDAPFPVDLKLIRAKDEAYWDSYGALPKAFVSLETGLDLWQSRFGTLTSLRFGVPPGQNSEAFEKRIREGLLNRFSPGEVGLNFQPVKQQGLAASSGATDFSILFIAFSQFLIISAALLVGLLFRLGVEQRSSEIGLLLSVGYQVSDVRKRFTKEAAVLSCVGALTGLVGAISYAWLMMYGLRTWWVSAVGTPFLSLHVTPMSLGLGYLISVAVVMFSIRWTIRKFGRIPAQSLLAGIASLESRSSGRLAPVLAYTCLVGAVILLAWGGYADLSVSVGLFFGSGALLLVAGLSFFSIWSRKERMGLTNGWATIFRMGVQSATRQPGRSLLCGALVGCACFVIVAVGANRHSQVETSSAESGTGGFSLVAESDVPLFRDLASARNLADLGFSTREVQSLADTGIYSFRLLQGEDVSCLNLYQPEKPRVLGVSESMVKRGGFQFQQVLNGTTELVWELLEEDLELGVIPAFGDFNSMMWIMHLGIGQDIVLNNELGQEVRLRLVGLLQGSLFQSEVLISERNFMEHFPSQAGYKYFLVETPEKDFGSIAALLESNLSDSGFDATSAAQKLANYRAVENTYMSTFQMLGGFGLLLGTVGLGLILVRNAIERSGELATMRAFGFRRYKLSIMLLSENSFLLIVGLAIGTVSALVAVSPHLTSPGISVPWDSLLLTLSCVFGVGLISGAIAVAFCLRTPLLEALRRE